MNFDFTELDSRFNEFGSKMLTQNEVNSIFKHFSIKKDRDVNTIMIVDDAAFIRMVQKKVLSQHGYAVKGEAKNGLEAIEQYKVTKPDLVIMNIIMPVMDGISAAKVIKEYDSRAQIVMFSTISSYQFVKESIIAGACGFIVERFDKERFIMAINGMDYSD